MILRTSPIRPHRHRPQIRHSKSDATDRPTKDIPSFVDLSTLLPPALILLQIVYSLSRY